MGIFVRTNRLIGSPPDHYDGPWPPVVVRVAPQVSLSTLEGGACGHKAATVCPGCLVRLIGAVDPFQATPKSRSVDSLKPDFKVEGSGHRTRREEEDTEGSFVLL